MKNKLNKVMNIILKICGVIYMQVICIILGIATPTKTGIISSYLVAGTIALFGEFKIGGQINE